MRLPQEDEFRMLHGMLFNGSRVSRQFADESLMGRLVEAGFVTLETGTIADSYRLTLAGTDAIGNYLYGQRQAQTQPV